MVTAVNPKLAKLKTKNPTGSACRTVMLGNPDLVQVPLRIEKSTGRVKNLDQLKTIISNAELSELTDLYESLLGKKTKTRKKEALANKINQHIDAVAVGYLEVADTKTELPEALAEAAGKEEKSLSTEGSSAPHPDEGNSYSRIYKGAEYTLTCMSPKQYRLDSPTIRGMRPSLAHPARTGKQDAARSGARSVPRTVKRRQRMNPNRARRAAG